MLSDEAAARVVVPLRKDAEAMASERSDARAGSIDDDAERGQVAATESRAQVKSSASARDLPSQRIMQRFAALIEEWHRHPEALQRFVETHDTAELTAIVQQAIWAHNQSSGLALKFEQELMERAADKKRWLHQRLAELADQSVARDWSEDRVLALVDG